MGRQQERASEGKKVMPLMNDERRRVSEGDISQIKHNRYSYLYR